LKEDGLIFAHNGTIRFSVSDAEQEREDGKNGRLGHINAITSIANSPKESKSQKIGKFGVGFKAVFQYTLTPEIYDIEFKFKIERLIVPVWLDQDHPERKENETLFYFPFNDNAKLKEHILVDTFFQRFFDRLSKKSKESAFHEISDKLSKLEKPLFFLRHLKQISWSSNNQQGRSYEKVESSEVSTHQINVQKVHLTEPSNVVRNFLVFTKNM
jgi:hypothetical protein